MAIVNEKGWWINSKGEAVHKDLIKITDSLRDELVEKLITEAKEVQMQISGFRQKAEDDIRSYFELLMQEYNINAKESAKKGNITLENFSATKKVEIRVNETLSFDEKLQIAKIKIDEYLQEITRDSIPEIKTLISKAFEVDKEGNIDSKKIFALKSYNISDKRWVEAMNIIDDSKRVSKTKSYIRFYSRENIDEPYKLVSLDIANC